jgi:DNA-directed RNA polymerase specialized sigma24 family protein
MAGQDDAADLEHLRLAREGSRDALDALIRRHQRWIYNIVRSMTHNPADAEDAT